MRWDVFISHASSDKEAFVLPLAEELRRRGAKVWLDHWEIELGQSIFGSIAEGLREARFGVVVLSKAFFSGAWPRKELASLFAREGTGAACVLPVWHGVGLEEVSKHEPLLADRMAADSQDGVQVIVDRIMRLLVQERGLLGISANDVTALTLRLFPALPVDEFWQTQLLSDLDVELYRTTADIELAYRRAREAVDAYRLEQPRFFKSGTDYLTKALGFVDLCFRSRHNFAPRTLEAFSRYADRVDWNQTGNVSEHSAAGAKVTARSRFSAGPPKP